MTREELDRLLERSRRNMTSGQLEAQRESWVVGELMLAHPEMAREEAARRYREALKNYTS